MGDVSADKPVREGSDLHNSPESVAEAFGGPVTVWNRTGLRSSTNGVIAAFMIGSEAQAAAHAINCHDELVEALAGLVRAVSSKAVAGLLLIEAPEVWLNVSDKLPEARAALNRARGEG